MIPDFGRRIFPNFVPGYEVEHVDGNGSRPRDTPDLSIVVRLTRD